jgi:hypothetical protein
MGGCLCGFLLRTIRVRMTISPMGTNPHEDPPDQNGDGAKMPPRGDRGGAPKRHGAEAGMSFPRGEPRRPENVHGPSNLMAQ